MGLGVVLGNLRNGDGTHEIDGKVELRKGLSEEWGERRLVFRQWRRSWGWKERWNETANLE